MNNDASIIIALASATGEKTSAPLPEPKYNAPLARAKEGAEGPRRLGRNKRPLGKKFSTKVEN